MSDNTRFVVLASSMTNSTLPMAISITGETIEQAVSAVNAKEDIGWLTVDFLIDYETRDTYRVFRQDDDSYALVDNAFESFGPALREPFAPMSLLEEEPCQLEL